MIEKLKKYNEFFIQHNAYGCVHMDNVFEFINRESGVIFTAPHSTKTFVAKKEKMADMFTGALAVLCGETSQCSVITRQKFVEQKEKIIDFAESVCDVEKHLFLDIHGMSEKSGFDLCIGLGGLDEKDCPQMFFIKELAKKYGLKYVVNHPDYMGVPGFAGRYLRKYNKFGVLQLEWCKEFRDFYNHSDLVQTKTVPFMCELAWLLQKLLVQNRK